ncbi:hypothetical protein Lal_00002358 [Lupinus albus]|uniref:Phytosulfokine n=1 Tax=Lupinus albus TaxID=3870 RepID=A0A6A4PPR9_LUPAL|nr:putative phytosulfokine [Lupinus albus]KAF1893825.1 hypothetical protein Lal_00002358 [Lupinus albus]
MSKLATIFIISLLICFIIIYVPFDTVSSLHGDVTEAKVELNDESCEGLEGKEDCLMRRTLAAHVDYIYTHKYKPRT